ncbi:ABC transporter permease [Pukyongiella litopenaei]|uniref:ABC transporter permease n=1 Tax=Pukyongiella litopenaei TaxID=2605946 RepID=A0A2S0MR79_9RHOB|nr:ABC transporter permease [Pukyongiella litopenaei]AVO38261.1 ABC transporter permease [Pukyongiella litopenaei]
MADTDQDAAAPDRVRPLPGQPQCATGEGAVRRVLRWLAEDRSSLAAAATLLIVLAVTLLAPVYADKISGRDPFRSQSGATVVLDGVPVQVIQQSTEGLGLGVTPIGPTWKPGPYFLGADMQGRDVMSRVLYGGQASLIVASAAAIVTLTLAASIGICAGFFGGWVDWVVSHLLDVLWAFPVYLFAISLAIVLLTADLHVGPIVISATSLWVPILIVGIIYVPYVARPIRGQVLALREVEFVKAAVGLGIPTHRILLLDILPNVATSIMVFLPMMIALNIGTESALSFLSLGVQPPGASWGTVIRDGQSLIYTRPWVAIAPGIMVIITIAALNVLGDGMRQAFDPRAQLRG